MAEAGGKKMKVKARLVDINGQPIPEVAKIRVIAWDTDPVWWHEFTDNVKQDDANPALAEFEVTVPTWHHITVCGMKTPSFYITDPTLGCPAYVGDAAIVDVGDVVMRKVARARFEFLNWKGEPVSGAKIEVKHVLGYDCVAHGH